MSGKIIRMVHGRYRRLQQQMSTINNPQPSYIYAGGGGGGGTISAATWQNPSPSVSIEQSGVVKLSGFGADVVINGVSLKETLEGIQARLNMLQPNTALEDDWNELQELGKQYRRLEAQLLEKQRMWSTLQK